jgi:uncharacterized LabA/DUF88 family protein
LSSAACFAAELSLAPDKTGILSGDHQWRESTSPTKRVWVDRTEEKGSDVNIAAHLLRDAFMHRFEVAVLVTNDSDLVEPVRIVRAEMGLPVGILNPHEHHSKVLRPLATFVKRIRQSDLIASQFPDEIVGADGRIIRKPQDW